MCKKKPYPRCSAHGAALLEKAKQQLDNARKTNLNIPKYETKLNNALEDFLVTPLGIKKLKEDYQKSIDLKHSPDEILKSKDRLDLYSTKRKQLIAKADQKTDGRKCINCNKGLKPRQSQWCSISCRKEIKLANFIRKCNKCNRTPEKVAFSVNKNTIDGLSSTCKECTSEQTKIKQKARSQEEIKKDKEKRSSSVYKNYWLLRTYGITYNDFKAMRKLQEDKCAICKKNFSEKLKPHVDHNHSTNSVRGLLCLNCNWGIGHFKDNPALLLNAIKYLQDNKVENKKITALLYKANEKELDLRNLRHLQISKEGRERLVSSQGDRCKICHIKPNTYHLDHSHLKGFVRGALCSNCNIGLGNMKENIKNLERAAFYLKL